MNRREAVKALGGATIVGGSLATVLATGARADDLDEVLKALWPKYAEARAALQRAADAHEAADEEWFDAKARLRFLAVPDRLGDDPFRIGFDDDDGIQRVTVQELRLMIRSGGYGYLKPERPMLVWARETLPAAEACWADRNEALERSGLADAEEAEVEAGERLAAVEKAIREAPAHSLDGLVIKARATWNNRNIVSPDGSALALAVLRFAGAGEREVQT